MQHAVFVLRKPITTTTTLITSIVAPLTLCSLALRSFASTSLPIAFGFSSRFHSTSAAAPSSTTHSFTNDTEHVNSGSIHEKQEKPTAKRNSGYCTIDIESHRAFFERIATDLGIQHPEGWYNIKSEDITRNVPGARMMIQKHYKSSLFNALHAVFPEIEWQPWRFVTGVPNKYWNDIGNQRRFFDWAAQQLGITNNNSSSSNSNNNNNNNDKQQAAINVEGWYQVRVEQIAMLGGGGLLHNTYKNSLYRALSTVYPEIDWVLWKFPKGVPAGFWNDRSNQRKFFDWAAQQLGVQSHEDWYRVQLEDVIRLGGAGLLRNQYSNSLARALLAVYREVEWQPWRFSVVPKHSWSDESILRGYMDYVAQRLHVGHLDEWYRVSQDQIRPLGGYSIVEQNGGLYEVLRRLHPNHAWNKQRFHIHRGKRASQRWMLVILRGLFPQEELLEEYEHPKLRFGDSSGDSMQLDVFLPRLLLAFEFQGRHHFDDVNFFGPQAQYRSRDLEKVAACKREGIDLIVVPYWWDRSPESLAATIRVVRPDLQMHGVSEGVCAEPIPSTPPEQPREALGRQHQ